MRMLKVKRFFIGLALFFTLLLVLLSSVIYFADVNDYSEWITAQVKQSTGYDIRFEQFDNNWLEDNRISLIGVSLYQQNQRIILIKKLDIQVDKLDLWQQQLDIKSINLIGVEVDIQEPIIAQNINSEITPKKNSKAPQQNANLQKLDWHRLHIASIKISELNALIETQDKRLLLKEAAIEVKDLLVINNQQLQIIPFHLDADSSIQSLQFQNGKDQIKVDDLRLSAQGDLVKRRAKLSLQAGSIDLTVKDQQTIAFDNTQLALQFDKNRLLLDTFSVDAFGGDLTMQADAMLDLKLLPQPEVKIKQVTLQSLQVNNMELEIPVWLDFANNNDVESAPVTVATGKVLLPIETMLIKQVQLNNINISSANKSLPLQLKKLDLSVNDFSLIKQNKWIELPQFSEQAGSFSLAFELLNWQQSVVEQFSVAGSLTEDDRGLLLLQRLITQ